MYYIQVSEGMVRRQEEGRRIEKTMMHTCVEQERTR
jgi:hypothetical protein